MEKPIKRSKKIGKAEAKRIVEKREKHFKKPAKLIARFAEEIGADALFVNHLKHEGRAFLFDKDSVLRHFFINPLKPEEGRTNATDLLVILGAHEKTDGKFNPGDPTICITGVKQKEDPNNNTVVGLLATTLDATPYDEHPPVTEDTTTEKALEGGEFEMKILLD